jgi:hypothetical protein
MDIPQALCLFKGENRYEELRRRGNAYSGMSSHFGEYFVRRTLESEVGINGCAAYGLGCNVLIRGGILFLEELSSHQPQFDTGITHLRVPQGKEG